MGKNGRNNLRAIREFERSKNKKNVRQLPGKMNFYYKFIEDVCKLLQPLRNLLKKKCPMAKYVPLINGTVRYD